MSKSSPVERVLATAGKRKMYLMGWVAAYISDSVAGDPVFYLEEPKKIGEVFGHAKIFKSQQAAEKAIRKAYPAGGKLAVRKYVYETHIPKHAKGMPEWTDNDSTEWIYLTPA